MILNIYYRTFLIKKQPSKFRVNITDNFLTGLVHIDVILKTKLKLKIMEIVLLK